MSELGIPLWSQKTHIFEILGNIVLEINETNKICKIFSFLHDYLHCMKYSL